MKRFIASVLLSGLFTALSCVGVYAATAEIGTANVAKGIVTVTLKDNAGKTIKAMVEKGGNKYTYTLSKSPTNLPLQMGNGDYKVSVLENVGGDKYKAIASATVSAPSIDEKEMYKASIPLVDYSSSKKAIPAYKTVSAGKTTDKDKATAIYNDVVKSMSYDMQKAASVKGDYVPVLDTVFAAKKGICYDYASMLGGALRSQGIPTRLVMGYVPEIKDYHAWNEILIGGNWVSVDATYDSQLAKAGKEFKMEKDKSKTKVLKTY